MMNNTCPAFIGNMLLLLFVPLLCACSNLAYQPSKQAFYNPAKFELTYEDIYFESNDGILLHGWFFPAVPEEEALGTVIQFHGNAENISTHFFSLAWVTRHGYNLFIFDYRGYGKSEGAPNQAGLNDDAVAALKYVLGKKQDGEETLEQNGEKEHSHKIIAYGQSLGGAVLLRAMNDLDNQYKSALDALVIESSFLSYQEVARDKLSGFFITWPFQPLAYLFFSDEYAPIKTIENLPALPFLVIHGDQDIIIPIKYGEQIYDLAKEPKWIWKVEGGRHIGAMAKEEYRMELINFFKKL